MEGYRCYMDKQAMSEVGLARLLELEAPRRREKSHGGRYIALAASLLAVIGAAVFALGRGGTVPGPQPPTVGVVTPPVASQAPVVEDQSGLAFVAQGPGEGGKLMFPDIHGVDYADVSGEFPLAASISRSPGSFDVELTKADILKIFWGPDGKPAVENPKTDTGDFPLFLMNWQGYEITGRAMYDETGTLWQLDVYGQKGADSFTLSAAPGHIPPTCTAESGAAETTVIDTQVKCWYRSYDRNGDGEVEHVCTSEFLTKGVGYRFENIGSGGMKSGVDEANDLEGAQLFNAMVVNHLCRLDGGLYLDDIAHTDDIPAWRSEKFDTLDQARQETAFAPYLPQGEPVRFGVPSAFGDFEGYLSYQEGRQNWLGVRWSRGYDDIQVTVWLPEDPDGYPQDQATVDVNVPESYDWRLYDGAICDVVPEEYQMDFYMPAFRAQDMSLAVVQARGREKDTGSAAYRFRVRHDNGVVVEYDCSAVSAEYVWSLVEATLDQ